jgi:hypothetical protein
MWCIFLGDMNMSTPIGVYGELPGAGDFFLSLHVSPNYIYRNIAHICAESLNLKKLSPRSLKVEGSSKDQQLSDIFSLD